MIPRPSAKKNSHRICRASCRRSKNCGSFSWQRNIEVGPLVYDTSVSYYSSRDVRVLPELSEDGLPEDVQTADVVAFQEVLV